MDEPHRRESQSNRKKRSASKEIAEMVNYVVFLAIFLAATFIGRNDSAFATRTVYLSQLQDRPLAQTSALRTFKTLASIREFHNFLVGPFYDAVYGATSFDGDTAFPAGQLYTGPGFLGGYGRILGTIRIGQVSISP
ncbi:unnamed protein product [Aphanomyces euteiches]